MASEKIKNFWIICISTIFILLNTFALYFEFYYVLFLPLALIIFYLALLQLDILLLTIVFFTPLSVFLRFLVKDLPIDMNLPTEPLMVGAMFLFFLKLLKEKTYDTKIFFHPISIAILLNLAWLIVTTISSTMPVVSIKFVLARIWFIVVGYFAMIPLFSNIKRMRIFIWLYILGLLIVSSYSIYRLLGFGLFDQKAAHFVMRPFFSDHTGYGAMLAMIIPAVIGLSWFSNYHKAVKILLTGLIIFTFWALALSYSRAAWLSLIAASGVLFLMHFRVKLRTMLIFSLILGILFFIFRFEIFDKLSKNKQDTSVDFEEQVKSITNIATDASNRERINRWNSAFRMFSEKPIFGWGPGTYMFLYAPFQKSADKTIISTNAGIRGNAHSEYLGPLAESGIFGTLTFLLIVILVAKTAINLYFRTTEKQWKLMILVTFLGLITYFVHGFLNNFLDTDKAAVPFWGFIAMLAAMDLYFIPKKQISQNR